MDSWAGRQWQFIQAQYPEKFASHNMYLHIKSVSTWLTKNETMESFQNVLGETVFFDDPRLSNLAATHLIHAWMIAIQQYKQMDPLLAKIVFFEGLSFFMPTTCPGSPDAAAFTSGREVTSQPVLSLIIYLFVYFFCV